MLHSSLRAPRWSLLQIALELRSEWTHTGQGRCSHCYCLSTPTAHSQELCLRTFSPPGVWFHVLSRRAAASARDFRAHLPESKPSSCRIWPMAQDETSLGVKPGQHNPHSSSQTKPRLCTLTFPLPLLPTSLLFPVRASYPSAVGVLRQQQQEHPVCSSLMCVVPLFTPQFQMRA